MNTDNIIEKESDISPDVSEKANSVESKEAKEENLIQGAEMLENPPEGNFIKGLQVFIAWAKSLID